MVEETSGGEEMALAVSRAVVLLLRFHVHLHVHCDFFIFLLLWREGMIFLRNDK